MDEVPDNDEFLKRVEALYSRIRITVERLVEHDGHPIQEYEGPTAIITMFAGRLSALTPAGRALVEVPYATARAVYEMVVAARDESYRRRADTGTLRLVTSVEVDIDDVSQSRRAFKIRHEINHTAPTPWPSRLSALLRTVRDSFGMRRDAVADALDVAMTWIDAEPLGVLWDAGQPVQLPHVATAFVAEAIEDVYLRVGQPAVGGPPSPLYRLDCAGVLTCVDNEIVVPPLGGDPTALPLTAELGGLGVTRWRLPCGGGMIVRRAWGQPQIVVRCDDSRGVFVQRG